MSQNPDTAVNPSSPASPTASLDVGFTASVHFLTPRKNRRPFILLSLALITMTLWLYSPAFKHGFISEDDPAILYENRHVKDGFRVEGVQWAFTDIETHSWQPITWLSHMLDCQFFGLDPAPHHIENVAIHGLNAILLFTLCLYMTGSLWRSGLVAALHVLHPLGVESVVWISARRGLLGAFFALLTLLAYVRYTRRPTSRGRYASVVLGLWLALASGPAVVTLPLLMLVLDHWPLKRCDRNTFRQLIHEKYPLLASAALVLAVTLIGNSSKLVSLDIIPFRLRIATAFTAYLGYIQKALVPWPLAHFYPYNVPNQGILLVSGFLLVLLSGLALRTIRQKPYLLTGWLWFGIGLLPVIGFVQVGGRFMADRFTYLPLVGLSIAAVWSASDWLSTRRRLHPVAIGACLCAFLALSVLARLQIDYWADEVTLYRHTIQVTGRNPQVWHSYAEALAREGRFNEAVAAYRGAIRIEPARGEHHQALALLLMSLGQRPEAADELREVLRTEPNNIEVLKHLGRLLVETGSIKEAAGYLRTASRISPHDQGVDSLLRLVAILSPATLDDSILDVARVKKDEAPGLVMETGWHSLSRDELLQLGLLLGFLAVALMWPRNCAVLYAKLDAAVAALARRPMRALAVAALAPLTIRVLLLPIYSIPEPTIHDEFGYLLLADTFSSGRIANPPHAMRDHFESPHILQDPAYTSIYPVAQGLLLASARVIGLNAWWAVWLSIGVMCASFYWMLAGWMPPRWALLGALLAGARFSVLGHWMNSYWGGSLAAIGGALVFGSLPRIRRHASPGHAVLLGIGIAVLSQTRPYEGLLVSIPAGVVLAFWFFRSKAMSWRLRLLRVGVPLAVVMIFTAGFTAYYNWRVTGRPLELPYQLYQQRYGVPQAFYWQPSFPPLQSLRLPELAANYQWQLDAYNARSSAGRLLEATLEKLGCLWQFYFQPVWTLPLLVLPFLWRDRRLRFLWIACLFVVLGVGLYPFFFPHYLAPICAPLMALIVGAIRRIRLWRPRNSPLGPAVAAAVVGVSAFGIFIAPAGDYLMNGDRLVHDGTPRVRITRMLQRRGGRHLIFVHYGTNHLFHLGLINNDADIDASGIAWARDLGYQRNRELARYYPERTAWEFDADSWPVRLTPFDTTVAPAAAVDDSHRAMQ